MKNYRLCIFDFDGTIVDSMNKIADTAVEVMIEHYGMTEEDARHGFIRTSGIPFFRQLEVLFPRDNRNRRASDVFENSKQYYFLEEKLFPEVREIVEHLRSEGYISAVSSSNQLGIVETYLKKQLVFYDEVLGFREGFEKGPLHFEYLRLKHDLEKDEMLFVGDSVNDGFKAEEYGVDFVARTGTFSPDDFMNVRKIGVVSNLLGLKKWFPAKKQVRTGRDFADREYANRERMEEFEALPGRSRFRTGCRAGETGR